MTGMVGNERKSGSVGRFFVVCSPDIPSPKPISRQWNRVPLQPAKYFRVIKPEQMEERHMKKTMAVLATVGALGAATIAAPAPAEAHWRGGGVGPGLAFGLAAGALTAGALASSYGPYYGPGYGYYGPAYGPGYGSYAYYGRPYYRHRHWRHYW
jgi:hypothetical protein